MEITSSWLFKDSRSLFENGNLFYVMIQPQGKDDSFLFYGEICSENLCNTLNFTIFVYANKGFAYFMFNFRDPDGYKIFILWIIFTRQLHRNLSTN